MVSAPKAEISQQQRGRPGVPHMGLRRNKGKACHEMKPPSCTPSQAPRRPREDARPPVIRPGRGKHPRGRGGAGSRAQQRRRSGEHRKSGNLEGTENARGRNVQQTMRAGMNKTWDSQSTKSSPLFRPLACISLASASALAFIMKTLGKRKRCVLVIIIHDLAIKG